MIVLVVVLNFSFAQEHSKVVPGKTDQHENFRPEKQGDCIEPQAINPMMLKMKREFIQENFVIGSEQKDAFWIAYSEYEKEILKIHKEQREFRKKNNLPVRMTADSLSSLPDNVILIYYENNFKTKNQFFNAEENFFNKLKEILKPQQIAQYYILEKNFRKSASKMDKSQKMKADAKPMPMRAESQSVKREPTAAPAGKEKRNN